MIRNILKENMYRFGTKNLNEQNTEDTGGILEVFKKYAQILESLVPDLENYANEKNSDHLRDIVKKIKDTVRYINNLNYDLDDLENFMSRICNNPIEWFTATLGLTGTVVDLYYKAYKQDEITWNKYAHVEKIYNTFRKSKDMLCYIGVLEKRGQSDSANDEIKKLDDLLSSFI